MTSSQLQYSNGVESLVFYSSEKYEHSFFKFSGMIGLLFLNSNRNKQIYNSTQSVLPR